MSWGCFRRKYFIRTRRMPHILKEPDSSIPQRIIYVVLPYRNAFYSVSIPENHVKQTH